MKLKEPIAKLSSKEKNIGYKPKRKKTNATGNKNSGHRSQPVKR